MTNEQGILNCSTNFLAHKKCPSTGPSTYISHFLNEQSQSCHKKFYSHMTNIIHTNNVRFCTGEEFHISRKAMTDLFSFSLCRTKCNRSEPLIGTITTVRQCSLLLPVFFGLRRRKFLASREDVKNEREAV